MAMTLATGTKESPPSTEEEKQNNINNNECEINNCTQYANLQSLKMNITWCRILQEVHRLEA